MPGRIFILLLLSLLFFACNNQEKRIRVWQKFVARDKTFSVLLPLEYSNDSFLRTTEFGALKEYYWQWRFMPAFQFVSVADIDIRSIEVSYLVLPTDVVKPDSIILNMSVNNHLDYYKNQLVRYVVPVQDIKVGQYSGRYFVAEVDAGKSTNRIIYAKKIMAGKRLYKLNVVAYKGKFREAEVDSFINSFVVLN